MNITVVTPASIYALPELEVEVPEHLAEIEGLTPCPAIGTYWQNLFNDQLVGVLTKWFRSPSFSRRSRRAYAKLNLAVRSVVEAEEGAPPLPQ